MIIGEALFRGHEDLSDYLRGQVSAIDKHVRDHVTKADLAKTDVEIARALLPEALVEPLRVDFEHPEKDVREANVEVHDAFDGRVRINGVRATRSFAFTGDRDLFRRRPDAGSMTYPHGEVRNGRVVIGMEGRNDPETLKREIDRQEQTLREYVGNSASQVEAHNQQLERLLTEAVGRRRQALGALDDLKSML